MLESRVPAQLEYLAVLTLEARMADWPGGKFLKVCCGLHGMKRCPEFRAGIYHTAIGALPAARNDVL
jgi:hypothetical protein